MPLALLLDLAQAVRQAVLPHFGLPASRRVAGIAHSGDTTFQLDHVAEAAVGRFLAQSATSVAYYTEDKGLVRTAAAPEWFLIIDPIDGTRPSMAGFEQGMVSVAAARYKERCTFGDLESAVLLELKSGIVLAAERGRGVTTSGPPLPSRQPPASPSVECLLWSLEVVGRPFDVIAGVLGELVDRSSLNGGVFLFNSASYSISRLVTGHRPDLRHRFQFAGSARVVGLLPYDIAAAYLIAREAGAIVTDACGRSLADCSLVDPPPPGILSCVATRSEELHRELLKSIRQGIERLAAER
jgi:myo-inositol-1(or 4)-monophosphatase